MFKINKLENITKLNESILLNNEQKMVFGDGNLNSKVILIGEAPGRKEVEIGKPFVGQAGQNLSEFLNVLNLEREEIYITNVVKYRPTKMSKKTNNLINRPPTKNEVNNFKEYLFEEINTINPLIIVTLGNTPLNAVYSDNTKIGDVHGKLLKVKVKDRSYDLFPLYHPASILYKRDLKEVYLSDLNSLGEYFKKMYINKVDNN